MSANTPMTEVIRTWRKVGARDGSDHDAEQAFDEANALGYTDRAMLIAASRVALHIARDCGNANGQTLDAMLETMLREFVDQDE